MIGDWWQTRPWYSFNGQFSPPIRAVIAVVSTVFILRSFFMQSTLTINYARIVTSHQSPVTSHSLSSLLSAKASCGVLADFASFAGELDALLGKLFSAAMLQVAGKCGFFRIVFHAGLLLEKCQVDSCISGS